MTPAALAQIEVVKGQVWRSYGAIRNRYTVVWVHPGGEWLVLVGPHRSSELKVSTLRRNYRLVSQPRDTSTAEITERPHDRTV